MATRIRVDRRGFARLVGSMRAAGWTRVGSDAGGCTSGGGTATDGLWITSGVTGCFAIGVDERNTTIEETHAARPIHVTVRLACVDRFGRRRSGA
jgi:hypothetical protein